MSKLYTILTPDGFIPSITPGTYAGYKPLRIFGSLDCISGKTRMHQENRVFFHSLEHAILCDYRPCQRCKPMHWEEFEEMREKLGLGPWRQAKPKKPY